MFFFYFPENFILWGNQIMVALDYLLVVFEKFYVCSVEGLGKLFENQRTFRIQGVRRHINWNNQRPDLKEDLAHLV